MFKCFVTVTVYSKPKEIKAVQVKKSGLYPRDVSYPACICEIAHAILGYIYIY